MYSTLLSIQKRKQRLKCSSQNCQNLGAKNNFSETKLECNHCIIRIEIIKLGDQTKFKSNLKFAYKKTNNREMVKWFH